MAKPTDSIWPAKPHEPEVTAYVTAPVPEPPVVLSVEDALEPKTSDDGEAKSVRLACACRGEGKLTVETDKAGFKLIEDMLLA